MQKQTLPSIEEGRAARLAEGVDSDPPLSMGIFKGRSSFVPFFVPILSKSRGQSRPLSLKVYYSSDEFKETRTSIPIALATETPSFFASSR